MSTKLGNATTFPLRYAGPHRLKLVIFWPRRTCSKVLSCILWYRRHLLAKILSKCSFHPDGFRSKSSRIEKNNLWLYGINADVLRPSTQDSIYKFSGLKHQKVSQQKVFLICVPHRLLSELSDHRLLRLSNFVAWHFFFRWRLLKKRETRYWANFHAYQSIDVFSYSSDTSILALAILKIKFSFTFTALIFFNDSIEDICLCFWWLLFDF